MEFRRIAYDVAAVATAIRQSELPDEFATDLETGGAPSTCGFGRAAETLHHQHETRETAKQQP